MNYSYFWCIVSIPKMQHITFAGQKRKFDAFHGGLRFSTVTDAGDPKYEQRGRKKPRKLRRKSTPRERRLAALGKPQKQIFIPFPKEEESEEEDDEGAYPPGASELLIKLGFFNDARVSDPIRKMMGLLVEVIHILVNQRGGIPLDDWKFYSTEIRMIFDLFYKNQDPSLLEQKVYFELLDGSLYTILNGGDITKNVKDALVGPDKVKEVEQNVSIAPIIEPVETELETVINPPINDGDGGFPWFSWPTFESDAEGTTEEDDDEADTTDDEVDDDEDEDDDDHPPDGFIREDTQHGSGSSSSFWPTVSLPTSFGEFFKKDEKPKTANDFAQDVTSEEEEDLPVPWAPGRFPLMIDKDPISVADQEQRQKRPSMVSPETLNTAVAYIKEDPTLHDKSISQLVDRYETGKERYLKNMGLLHSLLRLIVIEAPPVGADALYTGAQIAGNAAMQAGGMLSEGALQSKQLAREWYAENADDIKDMIIAGGQKGVEGIDAGLTQAATLAVAFYSLLQTVITREEPVSIETDKTYSLDEVKEKIRESAPQEDFVIYKGKDKDPVFDEPIPLRLQLWLAANRGLNNVDTSMRFTNKEMDEIREYMQSIKSTKPIDAAAIFKHLVESETRDWEFSDFDAAKTYRTLTYNDLIRLDTTYGDPHQFSPLSTLNNHVVSAETTKGAFNFPSAKGGSKFHITPIQKEEGKSSFDEITGKRLGWFKEGYSTRPEPEGKFKEHFYHPIFYPTYRDQMVYQWSPEEKLHYLQTIRGGNAKDSTFLTDLQSNYYYNKQVWDDSSWGDIASGVINEIRTGGQSFRKQSVPHYLYEVVQQTDPNQLPFVKTTDGSYIVEGGSSAGVPLSPHPTNTFYAWLPITPKEFRELEEMEGGRNIYAAISGKEGGVRKPFQTTEYHRRKNRK